MVMLSQRSVSELKNASLQRYLHMVRLEGGGIELPLVALIIPYEGLAVLSNKRE